MSLRGLMMIVVLGTLLSWISWAMILFRVSPQEAGFMVLTVFYVTLAVACTGTVALLLAFIRIKLFRHHGLPSREIQTAFRHAIFFSFVTVASLALSQHGLFHTWHVIALIAVVSIVEFMMTQTVRDGS